MPDRDTLRVWIQRLLGPRRPIAPMPPLDEPRQPLPPMPPLDQPLIRCPRCRAHRVVPVDWHEHGLDAWWMALRCGECGATRDVIASDEEAERFGNELDVGIAELAAALRRLERARMSADIDTLVAALERDLINAGDFER
jgi:hypothetical protein